ncbi:MAG: hypothetical protein HUK25_07230 [Treponema sp.]|nr:hypothetical protein [Treponema sp.]
MIALIVGIVFIVFTVFAVLPQFPLNWGTEVIAFLKGCAPVLAAFIGLVCVFIGAADIKDKKEAKKEELAERLSEADKNTAD